MSRCSSNPTSDYLYPVKKQKAKLKAVHIRFATSISVVLPLCMDRDFFLGWHLTDSFIIITSKFAFHIENSFKGAMWRGYCYRSILCRSHYLVLLPIHKMHAPVEFHQGAQNHDNFGGWFLQAQHWNLNEKLAYFSSFNPCPSLPSVATDDKNQFRCINIVLNNMTGPLLPVEDKRSQTLRTARVTHHIHHEIPRKSNQQFRWNVSIAKVLNLLWQSGATFLIVAYSKQLRQQARRRSVWRVAFGHCILPKIARFPWE